MTMSSVRARIAAMRAHALTTYPPQPTGYIGRHRCEEQPTPATTARREYVARHDAHAPHETGELILAGAGA